MIKEFTNAPEAREFMYEGKAKKIYTTDDPELVRIYYKDDATAFDGKKRGTILDKGVVNNRTSGIFFSYLEDNGIPTHFQGLVNEREMITERVEIIQVEVVVRNVVAGSLAKRIGLAEGTVLAFPVLEFYYKSDELGDPLINESHMKVLNLATPEELEIIGGMALRINGLMVGFVEPRGLRLVDFKLEFGKNSKGQIILADEISPDTCRFWDLETGKSLDKDRFRRDLGEVEEAYHEVLRRLEVGLNG